MQVREWRNMNYYQVFFINQFQVFQLNIYVSIFFKIKLKSKLNSVPLLSSDYGLCTTSFPPISLSLFNQNKRKK